MKIKHFDEMYTESTTPTPDEAAERVRIYLQQRKEANKGKPGFASKRVSPEEHERNMLHREYDRAEQQQRDDRATSMEESLLNEISSEVLGKYKTAAGEQASAADKKGDTKTADKRFSGIIKATKKQFDNDKKQIKEESSRDAVSSAIIRRISHQHPGLLKYGPDAVMTAIDWVARDVGDVTEIGSSDVSGWVQKVITYVRTSAGEGIKEGSAQWINRSAPAQDVSYEKTLEPTTDTWKGQKVTVNEISKGAEEKWVAGANKWRSEQTAKGGGADPKVVAKADQRAERTMKIKNKHASKQINELSVNTLKKYSNSVEQLDPATTPKFKMVKHEEGHATAGHKIAQKTGDRSSKMYESMLKEFVDEAMGFAGIANKQHAQKAKPAATLAKDLPLSNKHFFLKYKPQTDQLRPLQWQIRDTANDEIKHTGSSSNIKAAMHDAEEWLATKNSNSQQASKNVTINFNAAFAREFGGEGATIYCAIWEGPALVISYEPGKGLQKTSIRTPERSRTAGAALLPATTISPKVANSAGLDGNSYYTLGPKEELDTGVYAFPLTWVDNVTTGQMRSFKEPIIQTSTQIEQ